MSELKRRLEAQRVRNVRSRAAVTFGAFAQELGLSKAQYRLLLKEDPECRRHISNLPHHYPFYWVEIERESERVRSGRYTSLADLATQLQEGADRLGISREGAEPLLVCCETIDFAVELATKLFFSHCAALLGFFSERSGQTPNAMVLALPAPRDWIVMVDTSPGRHFDLVARPD